MMKGSNSKRPSSQSEQGSFFLGLVPFGVGVFLGVLVVQAVLRPPAGRPEGTAAIADAVIGAVGAVTGLMFALGCVVLGVRWFLGGKPDGFWNHLVGVAGLSLSFALVAGACVTGAGGTLGNTFPRLVGTPLGSMLGFALGVAAAVATVYLSWLQHSSVLESVDLKKELADRARALTARLFGGKKITGGERGALTEDPADGVTAAEAHALLPQPAAVPAQALRPDLTPASYPTDPKKTGDIPEGAQPIGSPAVASERAPVEVPAPDSSQPSTVYRWTPGAGSGSSVAADQHLVDAGAGQAPLAAKEGGEGTVELEDSGDAVSDEPAEVLPAELSGPEPEPEPETPPAALPVADGPAPPLAGRPIPAEARKLATAATPKDTPPRPSWERTPVPEVVEAAEPAAELEQAGELVAKVEPTTPTPEPAFDLLAQLERDLEASVERFDAELSAPPTPAAEAEEEEEWEEEEEEAEEEVYAEGEEPEEELEEEYEEEEAEGEEVYAEGEEYEAELEEEGLEEEGLEEEEELEESVETAAEEVEEEAEPEVEILAEVEEPEEQADPELELAAVIEAAPAAQEAVQQDLFATEAAPQPEPESEPTIDAGSSEPLEEREHVLTPQAAANPEDALKLPSKLAIDAGNLFLERERVAVSMLQRQFGIDFDACCLVLDELQQHGLIGPYMGGQQRDILMTRDQWLEHVGQV